MRRLYQAVGILVFLSLSCQTKQELASNPAELADAPDQESWNAHISTSTSGKMASKIKYGHLQKFSKKRVIELSEGVEIDFYDDDGQHASKVKSDAATLNETNNNVELSGNVVFVSDKGLNVSTTKLSWHEKESKVTSSELVRVITAEKDTIFGIGFESEQSLEKWTILKPWGVTQKKLNLRLTESTGDSVDAKN